MDIEHARGDYLTSEQIALALYVEALVYLSNQEGDAQHDANAILNGGDWSSSLTNMKVTGFLRACMHSDNYNVLRLTKIYPGVDVVRLADALRVEYAIRKFGGRNVQSA